jgi:hypothetical protein
LQSAISPAGHWAMAVPAEASRVAAEASMPKWKRFIVLVSSEFEMN